jgi:hypothetical protein
MLTYEQKEQRWLAKKPHEEKKYFIEKRESDRINTDRQREKREVGGKKRLRGQRYKRNEEELSEEGTIKRRGLNEQIKCRL